MTRKLLLLICLYLPLTSEAQQVVSALGGTYSSTTGSIEYSLGEVSILTLNNTQNSLTQGLLQPSLSILDVDDFDHLSIKIYPNPSSSVIHIKLLNLDKVKYTLLDIQGRTLKESTITNRFATIDLLNLAQGVYLFKVENNLNDKQKTYRIIKN
ncbi:T9SS type A sorting domain-containing protein [Flavobacteriaceae bacterium F08102]|nr:T9SS type A sorting domain-containing protein [Flavobacteriaceae bacterium F08102]